MIRVAQGEAEATLSDGRVLRLRIDNEALIAAEDAADVDVMLLLERVQLLRMGALRCMLFGALRAHHPALDLAAATTLMFDHAEAIMPPLTDAMQAAFPQAAAAAEAARATRAEGKASARKKGNGGKTSSPTGSKPDSTPTLTGTTPPG